MEAGASCQVLGAARALVTEEGRVFLLLRTEKAGELAADPQLRMQQVTVTGDYLPEAKVLIVRDYTAAGGVEQP